MANQFQSGDRVEWQAGTGTTTGKIQKKVTKSTEVNGQTVDASEDSPRYLVKNDNTGTVTGHRPEALHQISSSESASKTSGNTDSDDSQSDREAILKDFKAAVNMTAKELQDWLKTDESKSVGQDDGDGEAKGHKSGKRIVKILKQSQNDHSSDDYDHMNKVNSYIHRHTAQKPSGNIEDSNWRYSLMNWGHDPLK